MTHTLLILAILVLAWIGIYAFNPFGLATLMWRLAGNSRTLATAYSIQLLAILEGLSVIDISPLIGVENGARLAAGLSILMVFLRLMTTGPVDFKAQDEEASQ